MVRLKKPASAIKAPSRAKPTTQQSDTDDSASMADNRRKTKTSRDQRRKSSGTQRLSKKKASQPRHIATGANVDGEGLDQDEDGEDNDGNYGNDPVEENEEENNGNENNDGQEASAEETNADAEEEEEEEEEDPYKQAETKMLMAETKLLLIEQKKQKAVSLRPEVARSSSVLISEVKELRAWLARETRKQEAAGGKKKKKKKSGRNKKTKPDPNKLWGIHGIIKESTYHYLVVWKGEDENGEPWDDWWVAKGEVNAAAKRDWAALKTELAADLKKKHREWEALEAARKKAEARSRVSGKGQGRTEDEDGDEDDDEDEDEDDDDGDEDEDEDDEGDENADE